MDNEEINREVAEKIMGWTLIVPPSCNLYAESKGRGNHTRIPHFSTDIAAAFQVVDKMREKGYCYSIASGNVGGSWCRFFPRLTSASSVDCSDAGTPEMAICLASLAAIKEQ